MSSPNVVNNLVIFTKELAKVIVFSYANLPYCHLGTIGDRQAESARKQIGSGW
jgi:hypothetical protein